MEACDDGKLGERLAKVGLGILKIYFNPSETTALETRAATETYAYFFLFIRNRTVGIAIARTNGR